MDFWEVCLSEAVSSSGPVHYDLTIGDSGTEVEEETIGDFLSALADLPTAAAGVCTLVPDKLATSVFSVGGEHEEFKQSGVSSLFELTGSAADTSGMGD